MAVVVAVDAGTTGIRALAFDEVAQVVAGSYRELSQSFPRPGWVEHDPLEISRLVEVTLSELLGTLDELSQSVAAIAITNQRETAVAWDPATGAPLHPAIVWQDRRTADRCRQLREQGHEDLVRKRTGLVLDSYFSATKWEWMFRHGGLEATRRLAFGTVDDWICSKLTGLHVTDASNASRTLLMDIASCNWSEDMCGLFGIDRSLLAEIVPSSGRLATLSDSLIGGRLKGIPIAAVAGDQQASLFGHGCVQPGEVKVTYGTGSFVLMTLGQEPPPSPVDGILTTVAWRLPRDRASSTTYALEGAVFSSGATIQWLRDGLGIIDDAAAIEPLARATASSEGVVLIPSFTGLGSPWWDGPTGATISGLTKGLGRTHLARAAIEAIAYQTRDVVERMEQGSGYPLRELRADGGAAVMDLLLQLQADQCHVPVRRATTTEATARGAALLAGLAEGFWSLDDIAALGSEAEPFLPMIPSGRADGAHRVWRRELERTRKLS